MNHTIKPEDLCLTGGFQDVVLRWVVDCFGVQIAQDRLERADRFIEESLELAQTIPGFTAERAHALVDYVFSRPEGKRWQEVGGVMVTLAALCNTESLNIGACANEELRRISDPEMMNAIRLKQASKKDIHGPLP